MAALKSLSRYLLLFFLIMNLLLIFPSDISVKASPDNTTIYVSEDATIIESDPDGNYGDGVYLYARSRVGSDGRSFLKFVLSVIEGATVSLATLRIYCYQVQGLIEGVSDVQVRRVSDDSWTELGVTWNNQKAYGDVEDTQVPSVGWIEFDVSDYVQDECDGDLTISFCLRCVVESYDGNSRYSLSRQRDYDSGSLKPELYVEYTTNNLPVNNDAIIGNMNDADNIYAQKPADYHINYTGYDDDGYTDIDYILVNLTQGATVRWCVKYDRATDTFSEEAGSNEFFLYPASFSSRSGIWINLTIYFMPEWDAIEEADLEIKAKIVDASSASDTDTMQTDYCDVVTNLVVSGFACDDDRGDLSQTITFSGTVYYANNPSSSTATTFYPPDAEFTAVHIYDSGDNDKGSDSSIVNGAFSVSFSASASVELETYNPYIDMADADYSDGEESVTDTFISDQIVAYWEQHDDSRVDVNSNIEWRIRAVLDYDDEQLGSGDSITSSWGALSWDAGNSWFDIQHSESSVSSATISLTSGSETGYGITGFTENITETDGVYDRIRILTLGANNTRTNINDDVEIYATAELEYDSHSLGSGDSLTIESLSLSWNGTHFTGSESKAAVQQKVYDEGSGTEATYSITAFNMNSKSVAVIWDRLQVTFSVDDNMLPLNNQSTFTVEITREFDSSSVSSYSYDINRDGEGYENPHTTSTFDDVSSDEVIREYDFVSVIDNTYGITEFVDPDDLIVVWYSGDGGAPPDEDYTDPADIALLVVASLILIPLFIIFLWAIIKRR